MKEKNRLVCRENPSAIRHPRLWIQVLRKILNNILGGCAAGPHSAAWYSRHTLKSVPALRVRLCLSAHKMRCAPSMKPYRMAASRPTAAWYAAVLKRSQCFFSSALTIGRERIVRRTKIRCRIVRCGIVRCGIVRCGIVRCGIVRCKVLFFYGAG